MDFCETLSSFNNLLKPIVLLKFDVTFRLNLVFNKTEILC